MRTGKTTIGTRTKHTKFIYNLHNYIYGDTLCKKQIKLMLQDLLMEKDVYMLRELNPEGAILSEETSLLDVQKEEQSIRYFQWLRTMEEKTLLNINKNQNGSQFIGWNYPSNKGQKYYNKYSLTLSLKGNKQNYLLNWLNLNQSQDHSINIKKEDKKKFSNYSESLISVGLISINYLFSWIDSNLCSYSCSHNKEKDELIYKAFGNEEERAFLPRLKSWVSCPTIL